MTRRELERLARAFRAVEKAIGKVDTDPADAVGGSLYPIISRISSDVSDGLVIVERALALNN